MQLINVIPISKGAGKETLDYFSAKPLKEGSVVFVPLRKKEVPAIVLSSRDIADMKTKIKSAGFALKKVGDKKTAVLLLPEFVAAATNAAEYFATTTGAILHSATPSAIWSDIGKIKPKKGQSFAVINGSALRQNATSEKLILQSETNDRFSSYKSLTREEFAKKSSVFLLTPTIQDAEKAQKFLKKGIEQYTFVFHGDLTKKEMLARWRNALKSKHPVLIIATGSFLSLPRNDVGTIIVERENSRAYKRLARPYLDMRIFAEFYAKQKKARIIYGDLPLQIETIWRYKENELNELSAIKLRATRTARQILVDMKDIKHQKAGHFEIISAELKWLAQNAIKNKKNIFVFTARRGLSSSTICRDCGTPVLCVKCGSIAALHATTKGNCFICHACGASRSANERCKNCASWKLETLGIGIQLVEKTLKEAFPKNQIFVIDKDAASTHKKALSTAEKFYATKGGILLGTEMALPYLVKNVEYSAVATIDSLLSLPEWRMSEKILSILLKIREITEKETLIQTRKPNQKIFEIAEKGNLVDFYKDEMEKRKRFGYPPFNVFIKISVIGTSELVSKEMKYIEKLFEKNNIQIYPSSIKIGKRKFAMHGLLRIPRDKWPDKEIVEILRSLPAYFSVDIDPESLL